MQSPRASEEPIEESTEAPAGKIAASPIRRKTFRLGRPTFSAIASAIFLGCLFFGLGCRFFNLNWDEGAQLHPDERFCVSVAAQLKVPASPGQFFDSRISPLSPANLENTHYVYGQLPLFLLQIAGRLTGLTTETGTLDPVALFGRGRFLSALFDCGTVWFTFLLARRFFDAQKALFCAALIACAALHIQQSHFFITDPFAAFFVTASFWAAARLSQHFRARDALLTGAFFGAALACKISAGLFGIALLAFFLQIARRDSARRTIFLALCCFCGAFLSLRIGNPMMFRGESELLSGAFDLQLEARYLKELANQAAITRGDADVPFNVQWIGRTPLVFSLRQLGFWAYGWPLLLSAGAGMCLIFLKPRRDFVLFVAAIFALTLLLVQGTAFSKFTRYFLPMTPFCALLAAHFWQRIETKTSGHKLRVFRIGARCGAPIVALGAVAWALCVTSIYARPHPRIAASRWIVNNIPPGTSVANETAWDEGLPLGLVGPTRLDSTILETYEPDTPGKIADLNRKLNRSQWIFLSSGRSWQNIPRWPQKWPVTTEFYRALFDGRLGFKLEKRFDSFPRLGAWQFPDAASEESLTVYDHPLVLLFRKTENYSAAKTREILRAPENRDWRPNRALQVDESALPMPPGF